MCSQWYIVEPDYFFSRIQEPEFFFGPKSEPEIVFSKLGVAPPDYLLVGPLNPLVEFFAPANYHRMKWNKVDFRPLLQNEEE